MSLTLEMKQTFTIRQAKIIMVLVMTLNRVAMELMTEAVTKQVMVLKVLVTILVTRQAKIAQTMKLGQVMAQRQKIKQKLFH